VRLTVPPVTAAKLFRSDRLRGLKKTGGGLGDSLSSHAHKFTLGDTPPAILCRNRNLPSRHGFSPPFPLESLLHFCDKRLLPEWTPRVGAFPQRRHPIRAWRTPVHFRPSRCSPRSFPGGSGDSLSSHARKFTLGLWGGSGGGSGDSLSSHARKFTLGDTPPVILCRYRSFPRHHGFSPPFPLESLLHF